MVFFTLNSTKHQNYIQINGFDAEMAQVYTKCKVYAPLHQITIYTRHGDFIAPYTTIWFIASSFDPIYYLNSTFSAILTNGMTI